MNREELSLILAKAICYGRAGPACSCKEQGNECLANKETLLSDTCERKTQVEEILNEFDKNQLKIVPSSMPESLSQDIMLDCFINSGVKKELVYNILIDGAEIK